MGIFDKIKGAIFGHKDPGPGNRPTIPAGMAGGPPATPPPGQGQVPTTAASGASAAQPAADPLNPEPVDVEAVLSQMARDKGQTDLNYDKSIVDLMKLLGIESSLDNRKDLAQELGYRGELDGSAEMNIWLHKAVMRGLAANGGKVPSNYTD